MTPLSSTGFTIEPKARFTYPSAKEFTTMLKTIADIVDEISFTVRKSGMTVKALDPGRVALLTVTLPPESFQEYNVEEELVIGLAVSNLVRILRRVGKGDRIVFAANEEYVEIAVEGALGRRYKFKNLEVLSEELPELAPQYDVRASLLSPPLRAALSELTAACSSIGVEANPETISFYDADSKKSVYRLTTASGAVISIDVKREANAVYDAEYVSKVIDVITLAHIVELEYGSEAPLHLAIEFAGGKAEYFLAQKV